MASLINTNGTLTADGTYVYSNPLKNPTYQLTGATWGSGTVQVTLNGVSVAGASYTAAMSAPVQIQLERPAVIGFTLSGSTGASISWAIW